MAKLSAGLLIFFLGTLVYSGAQEGPLMPWHSSATLETNWAARTSEVLTFRGSSSEIARSGIFSLDSGGITFQPKTGKTLRWPYTEIETFDLTNPSQLTLTTYENKSWHTPGEKGYTFLLAEPVPPRVAAELAQNVAKPSRNGLSTPSNVAFASIPARHPTHLGGTSGTLRFTESGIEYATPRQNDSRNWRWSDIRTIANPDPYRLRIDGYRETYDFLLKESLSSDLFDKLWDYVYTKDLNVSVGRGRS
jgi:hypothetical protein